MCVINTFFIKAKLQFFKCILVSEKSGPTPGLKPWTSN